MIERVENRTAFQRRNVIGWEHSKKLDFEVHSGADSVNLSSRIRRPTLQDKSEDTIVVSLLEWNRG